MSEENEQPLCKLALSEKAKDNRPGVVEELLVDIREALPGVFTHLSVSGKKWLRGKSEQESAKAHQILSEVIDRIGRLKLDERDQQHRHAIEKERHDVDMQAKRMELYVSSLERVVKVVRELNGMGVDVDMTALLRGIPVPLEMVSAEGSGPAGRPTLES